MEAAILGVGISATVLDQLYIPIYVFLYLKIITWGQLYQQLVKFVTSIYFCFFACKNCNTGINIPVADLLVAILL